jgi:hypothetical protein
MQRPSARSPSTAVGPYQANPQASQRASGFGVSFSAGLRRLVQRAARVPSRCSSAFEIFCAAGSVEADVFPGAWAYG